MSKSYQRAQNAGTRVQTSRSSNSEEDRLLRAITKKKALKKYAEELDKVERGTLDVPGFIRKLSLPMVENILYTIETTEDEKLRVSASQDMLDRAGHGKVTKSMVAHAFGSFDETKRELVNEALTLAKKSGVFKVKEKPIEEDTDTNVVDVDVVQDGEPGKD